MTKTLAQKLLDVQKSIGALKKDSDNPYFKSKYADLNQVLEVAKQALHPEGIVIVQGPGHDANGKYIQTVLLDTESGQSIDCKVPFSGAESDMQKIGAAITYARRFGLVSLLALEQEDDDGEAAVGRSSNNTPKREPSSSAGGGQAPRSVTAPKANSPVQAEVSKGVNRKALNEKISLTSKVIVDSKRDSADNIIKMVTSFGVKTKEELTDEQAVKLLSQLEAKLK